MAMVEGGLWGARGAAQSRLPSIWRMAVSGRWLIAIAGAFVLLRIPSFVEPTWYSDAGIYADIGWALNHGARLYVDVWDNKPPGIYWLSALLIGHVPIAIAMPLAATVLTAATALGVAGIGKRVGGHEVATIAALSYVVVASLPSLDGDLFNAELCGATCVALAIAIVLRSSRPAWLIVAGALAGLALLFKAVFAADLVVVMGVAAMVAIAQGRAVPTNSRLRAAFTVLAGWSIVVAASALALSGQGSLGAAIAVLARSDVSYVAAYGSEGYSSTLGAILTAARILIPVCACAGFAAALIARRLPTAAALAWWLGWDVAFSMVSGRGFPHYVQQAEPAICLALAVAASGLANRFGQKGLLAGATVATATFSCLLVVWVPSAELALAHGRGLPGIKVDTVASSQLPVYYVDGYRKLVDPSAAPTFDRLFPTNLTLQRIAVSEIDSHSTPGDHVFVWGWIPWIYTLSDRVPAARYVALDSAYYVEPSAQVTLLSDLEAHPPAVMIVETRNAPGALLDFLRRHDYGHAVVKVEGGDFWFLPASPSDGPRNHRRQLAVSIGRIRDLVGLDLVR